jgi:hypothetical protein
MNARIKLLNRIGQAATGQMTTDEVNKMTSVAGTPPVFLASSIYPSLIIGFTAKNVPWINGLSNVLNEALYYSSNGQVNLTIMRNNNFTTDTSQMPSEDLKNIAIFCKMVYQYLFTNKGANFTQALTPQEISEKVNFLNNHQSLNNLPVSMSSGQLTAKLGGNLKTIIKNYLLQIK